MSKNIFDATLEPDNDVKVNVFDWSHANNLTTQIGRITPCFCQLMPAKSSLRIRPSMAFQFMPMVFPIQTPMRARVSFFRYPLRSLWKDYKDFVGNFRNDLEEPYLNLDTADKVKRMVGTGSLGDYLGIPSTVTGSYGQSRLLTHSPSFCSINFGWLHIMPEYSSFSEVSIGSSVADIVCPTAADTTHLRFTKAGLASSIQIPVGDSYEISFIVATRSDSVSNMRALLLDGNLFTINNNIITDSFSISDASIVDVTSSMPNVSSGHAYLRVTLHCTNTSSAPYYVTQIGLSFTANDWNSFHDAFPYNTSFNILSNTDAFFSGLRLFHSGISELDMGSSPFYGVTANNTDNHIKLAAYSHRAYEGIYNSYFRDKRNNPYYVNGQVQYNEWLPTRDGGADNNIYELHYANWEKDFLTTAVQSPQQGQAPLVGITTYTQTYQDTETGRTVEMVKTGLVDEDGKKYALSFETSDDGLEGVSYTELSDNTSMRQARNLYDLATSGIRIEDLRAVNAYQKFLELNMRKDYSYKEIIEGRFNVKVRYADLLLPEFFGGFSEDINVRSVTQTTDLSAGGSPSYAEALGSQAGIAGVQSSSNHTIECFCDEESIIIGLVVITPLPVYTQLLPKHFTYRGLLDHYQPEFNHIGFQPITYKEVCPIQAFGDNPASLTDVFGYQRPWYEYCQLYDTAHGLFRTDLSNFLMHRVFNSKPMLSQKFLTIDPDEVTDVFAVTETTDKVYGQIRFEATAKLPIARVAIPRLD